MAFDDENLKKSEEDFERKLKLAREFGSETAPIFAKNMEEVMPVILRIIENPIRSPQEIEILEKFRELVSQFKTVAENSQLVSREKLYRDSRAYFENVKNLAKEGDEKAKEIYENLKKDLPNEDFSKN